nr:hypothetical protein Itr_chr12CG17650 [Ipomoea trifida]
MKKLTESSTILGKRRHNVEDKVEEGSKGLGQRGEEDNGKIG